MKNTFRSPYSGKRSPALCWAFFCVWFAGALLFFTATTTALQICGLIVAISGAFGAILFYDGHDFHRYIMGFIVFQSSSIGNGKQLEALVAGIGTFAIGAIAAALLWKKPQDS